MGRSIETLGIIRDHPVVQIVIGGHEQTDIVDPYQVVVRFLDSHSFNSAVQLFDLVVLGFESFLKSRQTIFQTGEFVFPIKNVSYRLTHECPEEADFSEVFAVE
ncbi:MAG: hypothetical protein ACFB6S_09525 [Geminicoccaceae bacterium]